MSRLVAPMALRIPISRMREVTVASMMFMMPMPLTSRVTKATSMQDQRQRVGNLPGHVSSWVRFCTL